MEMVPAFGFRTGGQFETRYEKNTKKFMRKLTKTGIVGVTPYALKEPGTTDVIFVYETAEEAEAARKLTQEYGFPTSEVKPVEVPKEYILMKHANDTKET